MGLQHEEIASPSLRDAVQPNWLGDPAVVGRLVGQFLVDSEGDLYALAHQQLPQADFESRSRERILAAAEVFNGENEHYRAVAGWNGGSLGGRLMAALGEFWSMRQEAWADNAAAVLFEWLLTRLAEAWKEADGDDAVLQVRLGPSSKQAVRLLLGTELRAG